MKVLLMILTSVVVAALSSYEIPVSDTVEFFAQSVLVVMGLGFLIMVSFLVALFITKQPTPRNYTNNLNRR